MNERMNERTNGWMSRWHSKKKSSEMQNIPLGVIFGTQKKWFPVIRETIKFTEWEKTPINTHTKPQLCAR